MLAPILCSLQAYEEGRIAVHEYHDLKGVFTETLSIFGEKPAARSVQTPVLELVDVCEPLCH